MACQSSPTHEGGAVVLLGAGSQAALISPITGKEVLMNNVHITINTLIGPALPEAVVADLSVGTHSSPILGKETNMNPIITNLIEITTIIEADGTLAVTLSPSTRQKENTVRLNSLADLGTHFGIVDKPAKTHKRSKLNVDVARLEEAVSFNENLGRRRAAKAFKAIALMVVILQEIARLQRESIQVMLILVALKDAAKKLARQARKVKVKKAWQPGVKRAAKLVKRKAKAVIKPEVATRRLELVTVEVFDFDLFSAKRRAVAKLARTLSEAKGAMIALTAREAETEARVEQHKRATADALDVVDNAHRQVKAAQALLVELEATFFEAMEASQEIDLIAGNATLATKLWAEAEAFISGAEKAINEQVDVIAQAEKNLRGAQHERNRLRNLDEVVRKAWFAAGRKRAALEFGAVQDLTHDLAMAKVELESARNATKTIQKTIVAVTNKVSVGCDSLYDAKEAAYTKLHATNRRKALQRSLESVVSTLAQDTASGGLDGRITQRVREITAEYDVNTKKIAESWNKRCFLLQSMCEAHVAEFYAYEDRILAASRETKRDERLEQRAKLRGVGCAEFGFGNTWMGFPIGGVEQKYKYTLTYLQRHSHQAATEEERYVDFRINGLMVREAFWMAKKAELGDNDEIESYSNEHGTTFWHGFKQPSNLPKGVGCAEFGFDKKEDNNVNPIPKEDNTVYKPKSLLARFFAGLANFFEERNAMSAVPPMVVTPIPAVSVPVEAKADKAVEAVKMVDTNKAVTFHISLKGTWRGTMAEGNYQCINCVGGSLAAMSANGAFISPWIIAINGDRNVGINIVGIVFYTDGLKTAIKVKTKTPYASDIYTRVEAALIDRERKIAAELIAAGMPKDEAEGRAIIKIAELYPQVIFTGKLVPGSRERLAVKHSEPGKKHLNRTIEIGVMKMTQMVDMQVVFRGEAGWLEYTPDDGEAITEQDIVKGSSRSIDYTTRAEIQQAVELGLMSREDALEMILPSVARKLKKSKARAANVELGNDDRDDKHAEEIPTEKQGPKSGADTKADDAMDDINFKSGTDGKNPPDAGTVI